MRRGTSPARVTPGTTPSVSYSLDGTDQTATGRLVVAADGRESGIRKGLGIELHSTEPHVIMAGMLVDGIHDWPAEQQAIGVEGDFHYLVFPQTDGRGTGRGTSPTSTATPATAASGASSNRSGCRRSPCRERSPTPLRRARSPGTR